MGAPASIKQVNRRVGVVIGTVVGVATPPKIWTPVDGSVPTAAPSAPAGMIRVSPLRSVISGMSPPVIQPLRLTARVTGWPSSLLTIRASARFAPAAGPPTARRTSHNVGGVVKV